MLTLDLRRQREGEDGSAASSASEDDTGEHDRAADCLLGDRSLREQPPCEESGDQGLQEQRHRAEVRRQVCERENDQPLNRHHQDRYEDLAENPQSLRVHIAKKVCRILLQVKNVWRSEVATIQTPGKLGLTLSHEVGYEISPRGKVFLRKRKKR